MKTILLTMIFLVFAAGIMIQAAAQEFSPSGRD